MNVERVVAMGIPLDENSSFLRGAAEAPSKVMPELFSDAGNPTTELGVDLSNSAIFNQLPELKCDSGEAFAEIESKILEVLDDGSAPLVVGGDHSITYPIIRAINKRHPRVTIVHIDAHPDLYDDFEGNPHSHASPFARIMENKFAVRLVQIGLRTVNAHQREQINRFSIEAIEMKDFDDQWRPDVEGPIYLSIDLDGIDPAYAPGVSHREPGGLSPRQVINIVHSLSGKLVGADIVEFNPRCDIDNQTLTLTSKLIREVAGTMLHG